MMDGAHVSQSNPLKENSRLSTVSAISCVLSMIGAVLIVMTYIFIPCIRNTTRKLVTCLTIADFITPAGYLAAIAYYDPHVTKTEWNTFCVMQSALTTYSCMVSFNLMIAIALYLFMSVNKTRISGATFIKVSNMAAWLVPGIIVSVASFDGMLGQDMSENNPTSITANSSIGTVPWCWIEWSQSTPIKSLIYMFVAGKGWEIACYLLTVTFYVLLKLQLFLYQRRGSLAQCNPNLRPDDIKFLYIWIILLAIRVWGTIRFFMTTVFKMKNTGEALLYLQAIGDPSQAFFNCILFCKVDTEVWRKLCYGIFCDAPHLAETNENEDQKSHQERVESEQTNLLKTNLLSYPILSDDTADLEQTDLLGTDPFSCQSLQEDGFTKTTYGAINQPVEDSVKSSRTEIQSPVRNKVFLI